MPRKFVSSFICACLVGACSNTSKISQQTPKTKLRQLAKKHNVLIGAAAAPEQFQSSRYAKTLSSEFNALTAENVMKWGIIHPGRHEYDFAKADELVAFAQNHNMKVRGHALVWHQQNPGWLTSKAWSREELIQILEDHIKTVVSRYRGKVYAWDVVNEGIDNGGYRNTMWYKTIGPEYISLAFKFAKEADPDVLLYYNDYSISQINTKSNAVYELAKELLKNNTPIDGIGFQLHLTLDFSHNFNSVRRNIKRFAKLNLLIDFTEIDIRMPSPATNGNLKKQADWYYQLGEIMLENPDHCKVFTVWGLSDANSWIPGFFPGYGHGLLFDEAFKPKLAYNAVSAALELNQTKNQP